MERTRGGAAQRPPRTAAGQQIIYRYMYMQYKIMLAGFGPERKPFRAILTKIQEFFTFAKKQRAA